MGAGGPFGARAQAQADRAPRVQDYPEEWQDDARPEEEWATIRHLQDHCQERLSHPGENPYERLPVDMAPMVEESIDLRVEPRLLHFLSTRGDYTLGLGPVVTFHIVSRAAVTTLEELKEFLNMYDQYSDMEGKAEWFLQVFEHQCLGRYKEAFAKLLLSAEWVCTNEARFITIERGFASFRAHELRSIARRGNLTVTLNAIQGVLVELSNTLNQRFAEMNVHTKETFITSTPLGKATLRGSNSNVEETVYFDTSIVTPNGDSVDTPDRTPKARTSAKLPTVTFSTPGRTAAKTYGGLPAGTPMRTAYDPAYREQHRTINRTKAAVATADVEYSSKIPKLLTFSPPTSSQNI